MNKANKYVKDTNGKLLNPFYCTYCTSILSSLNIRMEEEEEQPKKKIHKKEKNINQINPVILIFIASAIVCFIASLF